MNSIRMTPSKCFLVALFLILPILAHAKIWDELKSPFVRENPRNILLGGAALVVGLQSTRNQTIEPFQKSVSESKPLGNISGLFEVYGSFVPNLLFVGYYGYRGLNEPAEPELAKAETMLKATVYAIAITNILKYSVRSKRPCENCDSLSFPSGHTTNAFSFAGVIMGMDYPWYADVMALSFATLTGLSRINDNQHYLNDVVGGAGIGLAVGLGLTEVYMGNQSDAESTLQLVPNQEGWTVISSHRF